VVAVLALTLQLSANNASALAATIGLNPTSGPAGSSVMVSGSGFSGFDNVNIYFANIYETTVGTNGAGTFAATISVPALSAGTYTVSAMSSTAVASANFTITSVSPLSTITVQKYVSSNGVNYTSSAISVPGNNIYYQVVVSNPSGAFATGVVMSDYLQPGQTPVVSNASCSFDVGTRILTCLVGNIAPGGSVQVFFTAQVTSSFGGTITNTASAQGNNTGAVATSNQTLVTLGGSPPPPGPFGGNLYLCGPVTSFTASTGVTPGSVTVSGVLIPLAAGTVMSGFPIVVGSNVCLTLVFNTAGVATSVGTSSNLPTLSVACGIYNVSGVPGTINVGGITFAVNAGSVFIGYLVPGGYYCFMLNGAGQAVSVLSNIPTSIKLPVRQAYRAGGRMPMD